MKQISPLCQFAVAHTNELAGEFCIVKLYLDQNIIKPTSPKSFHSQFLLRKTNYEGELTLSEAKKKKQASKQVQQVLNL